MTTTSDDSVLGDLELAIGQLSIGTVRVIDVRAERDWDGSGTERVRLAVTLADPENGAETWPGQDRTELSRRVRQIGFDRNLDLHVTYTNPTTGTADDPEPTDEYTEVPLRRGDS